MGNSSLLQENKYMKIANHKSGASSGKTKNSQDSSRYAGNFSSVLSPILNYQGPWDNQAAGHFLRRVTFGSSYTQIIEAKDMGHDALIDLVLADQAMPDAPINYYFEEDPAVPVGTTWVDVPLTQDISQGYRARSLRGWTVQQAIDEGLSVRERMVIFWHNHFVTANIGDRRFVYEYINTIRENALGNFRDLVKLITIDPSMLRYLNGNSNTKNAPNENYARELLELFTIGKGPLVAPGDYTNYTEHDIVEIAKVLTGWRDRGHNSSTLPVYVEFVPNRHDETTKTLSHRFDEQSIENGGDQEYLSLIDIIFEKQEVARFICRKLYRYFVSDDLTEDVNNTFIEDLAQVMIDNDYEIKPTLAALFKSDQFMKEEQRGVLIKNPLDFMMSVVKSTNVDFLQDNDEAYYTMTNSLFFRLRDAQMEIYKHESVAGWAAYYQAPSFSKMWLNAVTMPHRMELSNRFTINQYNNGGNSYRIDVLSYVTELSNPFDPNALIDDLALVLYPKSITDGQKEFLKSVLIPGLPDFEWTTEYAEYLADPSNTNVANSVRNKLRNLFDAMMNLSEFYLF